MNPNGSRYAQISETLIDHPKTTRAIRLLRIHRMQFVGHLACLWNWALNNAPDGDLTRYSVRDIADAARFTNPDDWEESADEAAERFIQALVECKTQEHGVGFLESVDGRLLIHDWHEYGGRLHQTRDRNAFRQWRSRWKQRGVDVVDSEENWQRYHDDLPPVELSPTPPRSSKNVTSQVRHAYVTGTKRTEEKRREEKRSEEKQREDYDPGSRSTPGEPAKARSSSSSVDPGKGKSPGNPGNLRSPEATDRDQRAHWIEVTLAAADADPERQHWRQALADCTRAISPRDVVRYQHRILANWLAGDGTPAPPGQTRQPALILQPAFGAGQPPPGASPPRLLSRAEARFEQRMAEHEAFFREMAAETIAREEAKRGIA